VGALCVAHPAVHPEFWRQASGSPPPRMTKRGRR
jgi:hypothetical protein